MSLDLLIGLAGFLATALVVAGMILIAPRGAEPSDRAPELAAAGDDEARAQRIYAGDRPELPA